MSLITIRELASGGGRRTEDNHLSAFSAQISFAGGVEYPVSVHNPFTEAEEAQLEWYFEEHLCRPFLSGVKAQEAAKSITRYGEELFRQAFAEPKVYARYARCKEELENLRIEIEGSAAFQALHWEALKDPDLPQAFALLASMVRRRRVEQALEADIKPAPALHLLIVTARPQGAGDIAYRTISRPLVDALRRADVRVDIDILRPGTFRALDEHLQRIRAEKGSGFYHLIHFDTHGALLTYKEFQAGHQSAALTFRRYGRTAVSAYEGQKAFLFFEGEGDATDPVEAGELAAKLTAHQIPITILNACQSGKQVGENETSLGSRLIESGVQLVLAMSYSITVSAAELLMKRLYRQLFAGTDMASAIRWGRHELANDKARRAYFDQTIELEDWLLPVVYQNQEVKLTTRPFTPDEERRYYERQASAFAEPKTAYGFVGRDLDILAIERRLLRHNMLLVRGMGGAGKSTLLQHLAHWWQSTDFIHEVFYFGYDTQAWTCQQIMSHIAKALLGDADYHARFVPLSTGAEQKFLADELRGKRHLIILDNLESITGSHLAIAHGLAAQEQVALHEFLAAMAGSKTLALLGSRSGETWLAKGTFGENVYELLGLDPEAASTLTERVLERHRITKYHEDEDLGHLLKLLAGFPLALEVVLANLVRQTPSEVLKALQGGMELKDGDTQRKTESILRCIDYSHSNLSPAAQDLLACLAPFSGAFNKFLLAQYSDLLRSQPPLENLPYARWEEVLQEAIGWGLLSPVADASEFLRLQPILPYFLKTRLNLPACGERRQAIESAFLQHYERYSPGISALLDSEHAAEQQRGIAFAQLEYENLLTAVHLALSTQSSLIRPFRAISLYLDALHDEARGLALGEFVLSKLEAYDQKALQGDIAVEYIMVMQAVGERQLSLDRYAAAEVTYGKAMDFVLGNRSFPVDRIPSFSGAINNQLGIVAEKQRELSKAEQFYQKALDNSIERKDIIGQGKGYNNLGRVAQERERWMQAQQYFQKALDIKTSVADGEDRTIAGTLHNMGMVSRKLGQVREALDYFKRALRIYDKLNDRFEAADTFAELGDVARDGGEFKAAQQLYQEALDISIEFGDKVRQSRRYHSLATVEAALGNLKQAIDYLRKSVTICQSLDDRWGEAHALRDLGKLLDLTSDRAGAEECLLRARELFSMFQENLEEPR